MWFGLLPALGKEAWLRNWEGDLDSTNLGRGAGDSHFFLEAPDVGWVGVQGGGDLGGSQKKWSKNPVAFLLPVSSWPAAASDSRHSGLL